VSRPTLFDVRFAKFMLVGLANTVVGLGSIYAAKWWGGFGDVSANLLGYGLGLGVSFVLNKVWTFRFFGRTAAALTRFVLVFIVAYSANLLTLLLLVGPLGIDSYFAQAMSIVPYTLIFYLGSRHFAFSPARD
jgi:putative flippase GtrA